MVSARRGASKLGCLFMVVIAAAVVYFGVNAGTHFWDYYQFESRMKEEARFAARRTDAVIKRRLVALADSLGLPEGARNVNVRRGNRMIYIWADYYVQIELPGFVRELHMNPNATAAF